MPRKVKHVLTVDEVAAELGLSPASVRNTMNRRGYYEVRGYLRTEVAAVKATRARRSDDQKHEESAGG